MTSGATSPEFEPATSLYERFLWSLFKGDKARYNQHLAEGPNKAALARALEAVGGPVLILLDELMDYVMLLSDKQHLASMPGEKAFLNNLMDAVDDVDHVAFVVVMIRSDLDERGYTVEAEDFRSYVATRLERNGVTVAVTEAQDFSAIIRRRLFERADNLPVQSLADDWHAGAGTVWQEQVFSRLGTSRSLAGMFLCGLGLPLRPAPERGVGCRRQAAMISELRLMTRRMPCGQVLAGPLTGHRFRAERNSGFLALAIADPPTSAEPGVVTRYPLAVLAVPLAPPLFKVIQPPGHLRGRRTGLREARQIVLFGTETGAMEASEGELQQVLAQLMRAIRAAGA